MMRDVSSGMGFRKSTNGAKGSRGRGKASESFATSSMGSVASESYRGAYNSMGMASDASDLPSGWGRQDYDDNDNYDWGTPERPSSNNTPQSKPAKQRSQPHSASVAHTDRGEASSRMRGVTLPPVTTRGAKRRTTAESAEMKMRHEASLRWPGYPLSELKGAGYNAVQLRAVGHTAADLRTGGFLLEELKAAGFVAHELKQARFRAAELKASGFHAKDLREAKFRAADLKSAGFSVLELKEVHHTAAEMKHAGYSALELKAARYKAAELRDAGYTLMDLKRAGFKAGDLREARYPASEPILAGYSFAELKAGGYPATELLRAAGYSAAELMTLRYTLHDLIEGGFGADDLVPLGISLEQMQQIGYQPSDDDLREHTQKVEVRCGLAVESITQGGFMSLSKVATVKLTFTLEDIPKDEADVLFA